MNDGAALPHDPLRPQSPGGMGRGALLALLVHVGLVVALAIAVSWRASEPEGVSAELWASVPQVAAPRAVEPKVEPQPQPKPEPKPVEKRAEPEPEKPDPQIAIEKAKREKLEKERIEKERAEKERAEKEKLEKEKAEKRKQEQFEAQRKKQEEERLAKLREDQIKRIQGLAGATGAPTSTGTAARDAGPSASYAGRIKARIKPNILFADDLPSNPTAEVEVRAAPDGTIVGRKLVKSSGNKDWDDAVLRAIDRTETLPRDVDGRVPSPIVIAFRPRE